MGYSSKVYCNGIFCKLWNRKNTKCIICKKYICGICEINSLDGKKYCSDCYLNTYSVDWDRINKEFEDMLIDLGIVKGGKENDNKNRS